MHKHIKKIIAIVLVLTLAMSTLVISSTAQSSISRIVRDVSLLVDAIKIQNNKWDEIGGILGNDADDIDEDDVSNLLGGADLDDVIDVIKGLSNAGIDSDEIGSIVNGLTGGEKISIEAFIDAICSASEDSSCIDRELLAEVFACIAGSGVDGDILGDIVKIIINCIDLPDSTVDKNSFGETIKVIINALMVVVDPDADGDTDIDSSTVTGINKTDWTGTWSTSMTKATVSLLQNDVAVSLKNVTARNRVTSSIAGNVIRITLSNEFGTSPLTIGEVTAAIGNEKLARAVNLSTMVKVTFDGKESVTIPAGKRVVSDPIKLDVKALDDIVISAYFPQISRFTTIGLIGGHCYASLGNNTESYITAASLDLAVENLSIGAYEIIPVLSNIDVYTADDEDACSAVFFGDSTLTNTIPILLAERLQEAGITNVGVLQQAIKGNELLRDGQGLIGNIMGKSGLTRFYEDAISQPGCKYIFVKIGLNDILHPSCASKADLYPNGVEVDKIIEGYKQLIKVAHDNGKVICFFTKTPFKGYTRNLFGVTGDDITWTQEIEDYAQTINTWLKSSDCDADWVIDLDSLRDPSDNGKFIPDLTLDGAHLTAKGCQKVADLIPLEIFGGKSTGGSTGGTTDDTTDGSTDGSTGGNGSGTTVLPSVDIDLDKLTDIIGGLINNPTDGSQIGNIDMAALIELLTKLGHCDGTNVTIPTGGLDVIIDLVSGSIVHPGTGIELGKLNLKALKIILKTLGHTGDIVKLAVVIDILKGIIKLPGGGIIGSLPSLDGIDINAIISAITGIINGPSGGQIGSIDLSALLEILKGLANGSSVDRPDCNLKVIIDLITGAIQLPSGDIIGSVDLDALKDILDKLGIDWSKLPSIDVIIDLIKGSITLPDGGIIGNLPNWDGGNGCPIFDKLKDIFDKIINGTTEDSVPGTTDPDTDAPITVDPSLDPEIEETLEDVDIITDLIINDDTPLGAADPEDPIDYDDFQIANTSDEGVGVIVAVSAAAAVVFVTGLKRKKD